MMTARRFTVAAALSIALVVATVGWGATEEITYWTRDKRPLSPERLRDELKHCQSTFSLRPDLVDTLNRETVWRTEDFAAFMKDLGLVNLCMVGKGYIYITPAAVTSLP